MLKTRFIRNKISTTTIEKMDTFFESSWANWKYLFSWINKKPPELKLHSRILCSNESEHHANVLSTHIPVNHRDRRRLFFFLILNIYKNISKLIWKWWMKQRGETKSNSSSSSAKHYHQYHNDTNKFWTKK